MAIPFLGLFKRFTGENAAAKQPPAAPAKKVVPPLEKASSERFSKTVMPNTTRTIAPQDPFQMAARSSAMGGTMPSAPAVAPEPSASRPSNGAARTIAFAAPPTAWPNDLPPAVALALEPKVERVIALELGDVLGQMPAGYVKPVESIDLTRRILVKASEVERGMANGKPAVSIATIAQQVPEIFLRTIAPSDASQVELPFTKVLEQFAKLQVRADQEGHQSVPQLETPFLKVTVEDSSRFGTAMEPLQMHAGELPTVRVEPPTAEAFAAAEPEPNSTVANPTRIPFTLTPTGTDVPASESVPASSGPSVSTSLPSPLAPLRIPFKMTAPSDDLRKKPEPWLTAESFDVPAEMPVAAPAADKKAKIVLPLKPIVQGLAPGQWNGDAGSVPDEARIELPFSVIEPQLAAGRITIAPSVLEAGLSEEYRCLFNTGEAADVILPLQEVLKNLPAASLRMRSDQEEQEAGSNFVTPFSAKAEEDAQRLNVAPVPVAKPTTPEPADASSPAAVLPEAEQTSATEPVEMSDRPPRTPLQVALDTDEKLDAKGVVARINQIPGVRACAIMFGDGLSLAGSLPPEFETDGLFAMAPSQMQRLETHLVDTKLGALRGMTLTCLKGTVTFFMHENLCLGALHSGGDLTTAVRDKLSRIVHELSRKYSHPV